MQKLAMTTMVTFGALLYAVGVLLYAVPSDAQVSPTTAKAVRVRIVHGPELESANSHLAIVRWTSNNPGGSPEHFGVVHYGTQPSKLSETAQSPIRLNPTHSDTVFRVRIDGLRANTTYYYKVDSMEANGNSDGVKSPTRHFTTRYSSCRVRIGRPTSAKQAFALKFRVQGESVIGDLSISTGPGFASSREISDHEQQSGDPED